MDKNKNNLNEFIILDLETIGLDKEVGKIIEIAALRVKDWEIVDEYVQLVNPEMKVPRVTTNLTGIRNADVKDQPMIQNCLGAFLEFIGDKPLVGHNLISFDKPFIEFNCKRYGFAPKISNSAFDTLELSIFLLPELRKHKLEYLYKYLVSGNVKQTHRAKDDCEMTLAVLKELKNVRDKKWEGNWITHVGEIVKEEGWTWADFILEREETLDLGKKIESYLPIENYLETLDWSRLKKINKEEQQTENGGEQKTKETKKKEYVKINSDEIKKVFDVNGKAGSLKAVLGKQYEYRKQQEDMALAVANGINNNKNLVVEAPTGCGKSLGYLIPAVCWSLKNNNLPVVVSTYTNALQDQLYESDFKLVDQIYDVDVKITVAKGRDHYVCIRKFKKYIEDIFQEEEHLSFAGAERFSPKLFSAFLANWIIKNKANNCDLDRFPFWLKNKSADFNKSKINSTRDSCQHRFCEHYNKCFVNRLKLATRESNVIVTNHSLVFSDPWDNPSLFSVLPNNFKVLVIDEAINIEDAATNASTETYSRNEFAYLVKDFFDNTHPKKGFLRRIENHLKTVGDQTLFNRVKNIENTSDQLLANSQTLFNILQNEARGRKLEYDDREEIFPDFLSAVKAPLENIAVLLGSLMAFLDTVHKLYCDRNQSGFCQEVKTFYLNFAAYANFLAVLGELNKNDFIFYRVINAGLDDLSLNYCHKHIGKYLDKNLYGKDLKSIIFTSATLSYNNNFDFINKIWGLNFISKERLEYMRLPYLFDYEKQCALILVSELPNRDRDNTESNQRVFYPETAAFLHNLMLANSGSALLIFTNKKDAGIFGELMVGGLEENNIPLYSTERSRDLRIMSGNKSSIVEEFKESIESCLIGTAGLREGINVPGPSLEMVVIVKLPFAVPSDPINRNRQMIYGGFNGYSLPHCIFNIKQAFGRLIRTKDDSGFVFIVDARIKSYFDAIKNNLPEKLQIKNLSLDDFEEFNKFLNKTKGMVDRVERVIKNF
ncbi:MAG: polymerase III, epsilon subunit protein [Candidatus Falkowbacteria bacterium GW2011_GWC2_38_22]|uniref:DNA 5'-3' helicase n=1 Tax=Candidatus Falkowbacteria bacterium GW2011_GWE1_38_31 TaxID=1618638 RepID=A0A0G0N0I9_9BACT|nr:MAG: polymerase III, epsilon subunit protein [Candidatus Falkowbacteria bacterium GW2011_GWF2_38_1205]KKQ61652.1 MAG: polymerase III, epsilon subunit protein [Candidatus Falkowbacteria bacterium GW2011_GWC2_38_22]KKQ63733.1 MAG: polymerase III, epsilon subunit protein [Candidatus Falkowbacteria bacterium GW2011_GWF1_38_22]KKQ65851.1 MAG: polymerase III, epsilon subunit protein [Candidatus Falkowbacteria bacterium GW2011_GWE2_38_254]KKQ70596.1 MAG: polymerase III, epsilon subunit protein [Can